MNRQTAVSWLFKALELKEGEELYLPCDRKEDVAKLLTLFRKELTILKDISPEAEDCITVKPTFKDCSFWVVLLKTVKKEEVAFKKSNGKVVKVIL
jgi:hypothetical protein